jgi:hypothetical protein
VDWLHWLKSSEGMVCEGLWRAVENLPDLIEEIPDDKDPIVITKVTLNVSETNRLRDLLNEKDPEFVLEIEEGNALQYSVSRSYPKGHWNPLSRITGARQTIGNVTLDEATATIEAKTLAFAARIMTSIIQLYGPGIEYQQSEYWDVNRDLAAKRGAK